MFYHFCKSKYISTYLLTDAIPYIKYTFYAFKNCVIFCWNSWIWITILWEARLIFTEFFLFILLILNNHPTTKNDEMHNNSITTKMKVLSGFRQHLFNSALKKLQSNDSYSGHYYCLSVRLHTNWCFSPKNYEIQLSLWLGKLGKVNCSFCFPFFVLLMLL